MRKLPLIDQVDAWLSVRHAFPNSARNLTEPSKLASVTDTPVFTPPRDILFSFDTISHEPTIESIDGGHAHVERKAWGKSAKLVKAVLSASLIAILGFGMLYTCASIIFGHQHTMHCHTQPVPNGWLPPGWANESAVVNCDSGYVLDEAVANSLSCLILHERCFVVKEATAAVEAMISCERIWGYTTPSMAAAARQQDSAEGRAAALGAANASCVPIMKTQPVRLFQRLFRPPIRGYNWKGEQHRVANHPGSWHALLSLAGLALCPLAAVMLSSAGRGLRHRSRLPVDRATSCMSESDEDAPGHFDQFASQRLL